MKNTFYSVLGMFLGCFYTLSAFAIAPIQVQIDQNIPHGKDLGVGSHLSMKIPSATGTVKTVDGVFLGKLVDPSGTSTQYMLLDETDSKVYFANLEDVEMGNYTYQMVLKPYDQVGGTCTGYAIDHFLQQMYWSGYEGNGELKTELSTEKGRTQLLVDSINEYYLTLQHRFSLVGVMNTLGARFGTTCKLKKFKDSNYAISYLQAQLHTGFPVMISFYVGTEMSIASVEMTDYEKSNVRDNRIWTPRKIGDRQSGGHSVVAASMFEFNGKPYMLMLDSDWPEPRLWDVNAYFNAKTAIDEIEFVTCQ